MSDNVVTPEQAQLARVTWILMNGTKAAGLSASITTLQEMAQAISKFMTDEGIFFDYQQRVDDAAAALERA